MPQECIFKQERKERNKRMNVSPLRTHRSTRFARSILRNRESIDRQNRLSDGKTSIGMLNSGKWRDGRSRSGGGI